MGTPSASDTTPNNPKESPTQSEKTNSSSPPKSPPSPKNSNDSFVLKPNPNNAPTPSTGILHSSEDVVPMDTSLFSASSAPTQETPPNIQENSSQQQQEPIKKPTLQLLQHQLLQLYRLPARNQITEEEEDSSPSQQPAGHFQNQQQIQTLKQSILSVAKKIFILQRSLDELSLKIALVIRNHVGFYTRRRESDNQNDQNGTKKSKKKASTTMPNIPRPKTLSHPQTQFYSHLLYLFKHHTHMLSHMIPQVTDRKQIDYLLQTIIFSLFADQFSEHEENLLLDLFEKILTREFASCQHIGSFMRSNTGFTKMLGAMMKRRTYRDYLVSVLQECVDTILHREDLNLELNPVKIFEEVREKIVAQAKKNGRNVEEIPKYPNQEEAMQYKIVVTEMQSRFKELQSIVEDVLVHIFDSVEKAPFGLRFMCKKIYEYGKERFGISPTREAASDNSEPAATEEDILSLVGGFVILRFLNPPIATMNLDVLGLKEQYSAGLKPNQRTNMKYVSKMIQNLSNGIEFGPKEPHLQPMNEFLRENRGRILKFFRGLCHVGSLKDRLEMIRFHELCSDVQTVQVSFNELAFMHKMALDYLSKQESAEEKPATSFDHNLHEKTKQDALLLQQLIESTGSTTAPKPMENDDDMLSIELVNPNPDVTSATPAEYLQQEHQEYESLCQIIAKLPRLPESVDDTPLTIPDALLAAKKHAIESDQLLFANSIKESLEAYKKIASRKQTPQTELDRIKESNAVLKDLFEYVRIQEDEEEFSKEKIKQLQDYLDEIEQRQDLLSNQKHVYENYLKNVLQKSYMPRVSVNEINAGVARIVGPFKYTIEELVKMGIITQTKIPPKFQSSIKAKIISDAPGRFLVTAKVHKVPLVAGISKIKVRLMLAELLHLHERGVKTYTPPNMDSTIELSVPLLVNLLNKLFVSRHKKHIKAVRIRKPKKLSNGSVENSKRIDLRGMSWKGIDDTAAS